MKRSKAVISKRHGITAVVATVISLAFMAIGLFSGRSVNSEEVGANATFACWVYSMIVGLISTFFYLLDGFASIGKAFRGILPGFNILSGLLFLGAAPMAVFVGGGVHTAYWYAYYLFIFVLEIISIAKHKKAQKQKQAEREEMMMNNYLYMGY